MGLRKEEVYVVTRKCSPKVDILDEFTGREFRDGFDKFLPPFQTLIFILSDHRACQQAMEILSREGEKTIV